MSPPTKRGFRDDDDENSSATTTAAVKKVKAFGLNVSAGFNKQAVFANPQRPAKRAFGALLDVTNIASSQQSAAASSGKQQKDAGASFFSLGGGLKKQPLQQQQQKQPRTILKPLSIIKRVSPPSTPVKPAVSSSSSAIANPTSPRRRPPSPPRIGSGRGIRLSPPRQRRISRIDPPSALRSGSTSSIAALLARPLPSSSLSNVTSISDPTPSSSPASSIFSLDGGVALPSSPATATSPSFPTAAVPIPESWNFAIYEDSPEETMQNTLQHATTILDISDDDEDSDVGEGGRSRSRSPLNEISAKGKENISPQRMEELLAEAAAAEVAAIAGTESGMAAGGDAMSVDVASSTTASQEKSGRPQDKQPARAALREMSADELPEVVAESKEEKSAPAEKADCPPAGDEDQEDDGGVKLPVVSDDEFKQFPTPKGMKEWTVWESDHEDQQEDEDESMKPRPGKMLKREAAVEG